MDRVWEALCARQPSPALTYGRWASAGLAMASASNPPSLVSLLRPSVCSSVCASVVCAAVCASVCLCSCLCICLPVQLSVHRWRRHLLQTKLGKPAQAICLHMFLHLSVHLTVCVCILVRYMLLRNIVIFIVYCTLLR